MALTVYVGSPPEAFDRQVSGLGATADAFVWIRPQAMVFEEEDVARLCEAFSPLRGLVWHIASQRWRGVLGVRRSGMGRPLLPPEDVVAECVTHVIDTGDAVYSRVLPIVEGTFPRTARLLMSEGSSGSRSIGFLPQDRSNTFADTIMGFHWFWLCGRWLRSPRTRALNREALVSAYVRLMAENGGAAGLMWDCPDARSGAKLGLVFAGSREVIGPASERLLQAGSAIDETTMHSLFHRGLALSVPG